jgi:isobutyryl-CoA mutase
MPVYPTMAAHFNDPGVSRLYLALLDQLNDAHGFGRESTVYAADTLPPVDPSEQAVIPPKRQRYLAEIADTCRGYRSHAEEQVALARKWGQATGALRSSRLEPRGRRPAGGAPPPDGRLLVGEARRPQPKNVLENWDALAEQYRQDDLVYHVRGKEIRQPLKHETLSGTKVPRVALPRTEDPGERLRFALTENLPGFFPYTAGVFPLKRTGEDPTRMFAGEGGPERTNRRFHLVSSGCPPSGSRRPSTR